ncbi:hypothetical protein BHE74_00058630 [Ensete ventricosum]|nr:hypothetical protein BHE74_00058630 [Ensete ventricosum]
MENELLKLTRAMEALRVNLPKHVVEDNKKSCGFETGLVWMEYDYQLALARFHARYLNLKIEEDPFKLLPKDSNVPMANEQQFDDSLPPLED